MTNIRTAALQPEDDPRTAGDLFTWQVADWADTAITALAELRTGEVAELDGAALHGRLAHIRQLREMLTAITDELLLDARTGPDGRPRMSWRDLGAAIGRDQTSVRERYGKVAAGGGHAWRGQVCQNTGRAADPNAEPAAAELTEGTEPTAGDR